MKRSDTHDLLCRGNSKPFAPGTSHLPRGVCDITVRVASAVTMVGLRGRDISAAETVTVLNDMCLMAPGALLDQRLE